MAFLRSAFISVFVAYLYAATAYALFQLLQASEPAGSWAGLLLAAGAPAAFFTWVFLARPPRTAAHPLGISIASGLGLAITMAMSWRYGDAAGPVHTWAGAALISWVLFLRWYSPFKGRDAMALRTGGPLPGFQLEDANGHAVDSSSFRGQPHVLVFYRGNWCPYCTAQVAELAQHYRELEAAGARVVMISPQSAKKQKALAARFDVPMDFMTDPGGLAAIQLEIFNKAGTPFGLQALGYDSDTVLPTVVITDSSGQIIFCHQTDNYRIRPEPSLFLAVLENHQA